MNDVNDEGTVRIGVLRLADSAPAVIAEAHGLFASEGISAVLSVEPSWANIADKLAWGALDAAIMLTPLAIAATAGLRGPRQKLRLPMGISRGGNAIVLGSGVGGDFAAWVRAQEAPPRFAIVHVFSTHNLLLRDWIARAGLDRDLDIDLVVVPPERVVKELASGGIMGFCAGAPWGDRAKELGVGRVVLGSSHLRPGHAEKALAVAAEWASANPATLGALVRAMRRAQDECEAMCRSETRASALAGLLSMRLRLPLTATRAALPGGCGTERVSFDDAARLDVGELAWSIEQMRRWGWLAGDFSAEACVEGLVGGFSAVR